MDKTEKKGLNVYSKEQAAKIGEVYGNLNTKIMKLEHEIETGMDLVKKIGKVVFSDEINLAFNMMIGYDLNGSIEASKEKILENEAEIKRINKLKEILHNDPKMLEVVAEFFSIVYQPEK